MRILRFRIFQLNKITKKMGHTILKNRLFLAIFLIVLLFTNINIKSQDDTEDLVIDSKEFYFNFMPNVHTSSNDDFDFLYVFITAVNPANVTIEAVDIKGNLHSEQIQIGANSYVLKTYYYKNYELPGDFVSKIANYSSQMPLKCGFHVTSDENIYVYTLTSSSYSSDAMIIHPVNSLGKKNFILSYNSDFNFKAGRTPSQFSIIATEDITNIKIKPSTPTVKNDTNEFSIVLNRGESYLVQAKLQYDSYGAPINSDLSGTYIESDKNIAVFAGHQRATIPILDDLDNPSRDFLCEQLIPVETWGKDAFVTPFPTIKIDKPEYKDIFRIISSTDNNKVLVGRETIILNKGQVYEAEINEAIAIFAERPIMTAQYKRSSRLIDLPWVVGAQSKSDPLMILVPPVEQFLKKAIIYNINNSTSSDYQNFTTFSEQYLVIVAPDSSINSCYIDNVLINQNTFKKIRNSSYSYTTVKYNQGIHYFQSSAKCGLYVYGYGLANSYGYTGGMIPRYIDANNPEISSITDCLVHKININDNIGLSYGLKSAELIESQSSNVKLNANNNDILDKTETNFTIELIDNNQDGYFTLKVTDKSGNVSLYSDTILGNSFKFVELNNDNKILINDLNKYEQKCVTIFISNNSLNTKTIDEIEHTNTKNYSFPISQFPLVIRPGEKKPVTICVNYKNAKELLIYDTLFLKGSCGQITTSIETEYQPYNLDLNTKCGLLVNLTVTSIPDELFIEDVKLTENNTIANTIFGINSEGIARVNLYDLNGKLIQEILSEELMPGIYSYNFLINNLSSGIYFVNVNSGGNSVSSKIIITK